MAHEDQKQVLNYQVRRPDLDRPVNALFRAVIGWFLVIQGGCGIILDTAVIAFMAVIWMRSRTATRPVEIHAKFYLGVGFVAVVSIAGFLAGIWLLRKPKPWRQPRN